MERQKSNSKGAAVRIDEALALGVMAGIGGYTFVHAKKASAEESCS
jgi:hypothetical protein